MLCTVLVVLVVKDNLSFGLNKLIILKLTVSTPRLKMISVNPIELNHKVEQGTPFDARYVLPLPTPTNAPRAGTRISKPRPGVVLRSDPFVQPKDRKGRPFPKM